MNQPYYQSCGFQVKVKKDQKGNKKKQGRSETDWKKKQKDGHPSSIDAQPLSYKVIIIIIISLSELQ